MTINSYNNWQKLHSCVNYQMYLHSWLITQQERRTAIITAISTLGKLEHNEKCGITTLNASWGFLIVPPVNFPEIKICFHAEVNAITVMEVLDYINKQIIS